MKKWLSILTARILVSTSLSSANMVINRAPTTPSKVSILGYIPLFIFKLLK